MHWKKIAFNPNKDFVDISTHNNNTKLKKNSEALQI